MKMLFVKEKLLFVCSILAILVFLFLMFFSTIHPYSCLSLKNKWVLIENTMDENKATERKLSILRTELQQRKKEAALCNKRIQEYKENEQGFDVLLFLAHIEDEICNLDIEIISADWDNHDNIIVLVLEGCFVDIDSIIAHIDSCDALSVKNIELKSDGKATTANIVIRVEMIQDV